MEITQEPRTDPQVKWRPHKGKQTFALTRAEFEVLYGG